MLRFCLIVLLCVSIKVYAQQRCDTPSITTASGSAAPTGVICPGELIFEDEFDFVDGNKWTKENTLSGGGNYEFQWYTLDEENVHSYDGNLIINPTLMADRFGEAVLTGGEFNVNNFGPCTDDRASGCARWGSEGNIINPVISGKLTSRDHFSFKYGTVNFRARLPAGDWLWPAVWAYPQVEVYGAWPYSGELDLIEGRGNRNLYQGGVHIGSQQVLSTLHNSAGWRSVSWHNTGGFVDDFHQYTLYWAPDHMTFWVDGVEQTIYDTAHPFDIEFFFIINLAIGGTNGWWPDDGSNPGGKPWANGAQYPMTDFWNNRDQWLPTWDYLLRRMQVDYIRVWAF